MGVIRAVRHGGRSGFEGDRLVEYEVSFGRLDIRARPEPGPVFRLAVLGDFSGRANAGVLETGAGLKARKRYKVDVDNLDDLLERLAPAISVAVDETGGAVSVPLRSMDDFHPDQLVENLPVLSELLQLRRNLGSRGGFDRAAKQVLSWSGETALPRAPRRAAGTKIATGHKLSDFARLTGRPPAAEADADALIRRLVGPFIVPARDSRQDALTARVDEAMADALRRVLHHPDFQTAEALWRGIDFLVRKVETGARTQIVIYDISAEEVAADLAGHDDLTDSGLYSLLVEQPAMDADQGALSMIAGLYQFEVTPPHADLLGRMARIAAAAGAPFVTGVGPDFMKTPMHDWHPLIKQAWNALRTLPASAYLGLVTPRFLLRSPYGKRSDPIDAFAFEEFTRQSGLSGMLWGHPALLTATLLAETWRRNPRAMKIGEVATVNDLPVFVYRDTDGEQIALPCAERLFAERDIARSTSAGINPVVSPRGRPEVRMGGFVSVAGTMLAGFWAPADVTPAPQEAPRASGPRPPPPAAAPAPEPVAAPAPEPVAADAPADQADDLAELDSLLAGLDASTPVEETEPPAAAVPPPEERPADQPPDAPCHPMRCPSSAYSAATRLAARLHESQLPISSRFLGSASSAIRSLGVSASTVPVNRGC